MASENLGFLLQALVGRAAHQGGRTLALMSGAAVTLQQVVLLTRVREGGEQTVSDLAERLGLSPPGASQAIDRLVQLGLLSRRECPEDRRRKLVATTVRADALLDHIVEIRSEEYEAGLARLPAELRADLAAVLKQVLERFE